MAENEKIIVVQKTANQLFRTKKIWQYDVGHTLRFDGFNLPDAFQVHFASSPTGDSIPQIGQDGVCAVPAQFAQNSGTIYAWVYVAESETGLTKYQIEIPVQARGAITNQEPTPVEQSAIDQAIAALNAGVEAAEAAQEAAEDAAESVKNAGATAETLLPGSPATVVVEDVEGVKTFRFGIPEGQKGETGETPNFTVGSVTTLPAGSPATVTITGTAENPVLNIGIPQGTQGIKGDTGAVPHFTIGTVTTLPPDSPATVTITGTDENPILNLGIPKGVQGQKGDKGDAFTYADFTEEQKTELIQGPIKTAQDEAIEAVDDEGQRVLDSIPSDYTALVEDVENLEDDLEAHKQEAENTYAKKDGYYQDMTVGNAEQLVATEFVEDQEPYKLRPSGGSADIGNRENLKAIVGGTVVWNQQVRDEASDNETEFANIVTVDDAVEDAAAVTVKIEPVQDLHGYDSPWPAGGGKNKFVFSAGRNAYSWSDGTSISAIQAGDDYFIANGTVAESSHTFTVPNAVVVLPAGTYTVSHSALGKLQFVLKYVDDTNIASCLTSPQSFTLGEETTIKLQFSLLAGQTFNSEKIYIQIESGSSATAWTPYENICPITGWDGVKVTRTGVNVWDEEWEVGVYSSSDGSKYNRTGRIRNKTKIRVLPETTYYILGGVSTQNPNTLYFYDIDGNYLGVSYQQSKYNVTFTTPSNAHFMNFNTGVGYGDTYNNDISINYPATDTEYHAYQGQTYSITLPTEAGTVYGGELTVNADGSGSLVVDRAYYDGSTWTQYNASNGYKAYRSPDLPLGKYDNDANNEPISNTIGEFGSFSSSNMVKNIIQPPRLSSFAAYMALKDGLDPTGVDLSYLISTPIEYTLTASQIETLLGQNNVWSNAGQLSLTYTGTTEAITLTSGKKYLTRTNGVDSMVSGTGQTVELQRGRDNAFDLTQMLGTDVADYVYGQGAGYFRKWFPKQKYAYNVGELMSVTGVSAHETVGFNAWDEEWEVGAYDITTGEKQVKTTQIRSKNTIPCLPNTAYYIMIPSATTVSAYAFTLFYDANGNYISKFSHRSNGSQFTTPANTCGMTFFVASAYGTTYKNDICINLSHSGSRNGEYQPYVKHSYPMDSSLTLRGIPKVGSSGVYWDGDQYAYDGTVTRKYGAYTFTGNESWTASQTANRFSFNVASLNVATPAMVSDALQNAISSKYGRFAYKNADKVCYFVTQAGGTILVINDTSASTTADIASAFAGTTIVFEISPSTTETAAPFRNLQIVDDWGTEAFVTTGIVPVGTVTSYPANLRDKLQHLPDLGGSNGVYLVKQTDSEMELLKLPDYPTTNGNYRLKLNIESGSPTFSWEVVT